MSSHSEKIYSIQLIRAIAASLVVLYHLGGYIKSSYSITFWYPSFSFGYSGVDLFFVLSGFIISHSSSKYFNQPTQLKPYLKKRIFRILPIYAIAITPLLMTTYFLPQLINKPYDFSLLNLLSTYLVFPNHEKVIAISWTLSHELFFYFIFSLLIVSTRFKTLLIGILCISTLNFPVFSGEYSHPLINFLFSPFNIEFFLGILSYYLIKTNKLSSYGPGLVIAGLVLYAIGCFIMNEETSSRILFFGLPASLILSGMVVMEKKELIKIPAFLVLAGDASYMIYLIHYPIISFFNKMAVKTKAVSLIHPLLLNSLLFVLIIFSGIYLYKKIEKPLLKYLYGFINSSPVAIQRPS